MSETITVRDIDTITTEIKTIEMQVAKMAIHGCIEIGRRLVEAKEIVGHGGWGKYLAENVRYSQQWATNLMNLYREYGTQQESLFESFANSKSFGNIDVTKHILLLAVPAEDRAEFAESKDVENKSVQELKAAIRDRDANLQAANEQAARAKAAEAEVEKLNASIVEQADKLDAKDTELEQLQGQVKAAEDKQAAAEKKVETLEKKLQAATDGEAQARAELSQAKANPEVPESVMEQLRREVEADATAKATEQIQKELEAAQKEAARANEARVAAEAKADEAQRKIQLANTGMVLFNTYLTEAQTQFKKMVDALKNIAAEDPATAKKLKGNIKEKLLDNLGKMIDKV
jgi:DNA repair exonuclease SbcCD ATPase subunit